MGDYALSDSELFVMKIIWRSEETPESVYITSLITILDFYNLHIVAIVFVFVPCKAVAINII